MGALPDGFMVMPANPPVPQPVQAAQPAPPAASPQQAAPAPPDYFTRNQAYLKPGQHIYNTPLPPEQEAAFRSWLAAHNVPFDPNAPVTDYDMRGFWAALQKGDPVAKSAIDPNDKRMHYPDYWKTPYHQSFSAESQWADPTKAPHWNDKDQLVTPDGKIIYDDRAPKEGEQ